MACNAGDTGNGATLAFAADMGFGTSATTLTAISITQGAQTVASIDVSTLATTDAMESIPSDLRDVAENSATYVWLTTVSTSVAMNAALPGGCGTITLTYPMRSGETTAAKITGTGFVTSFTPPTFANGQLQTGAMSWKWDGGTGPTFSGSA